MIYRHDSDTIEKSKNTCNNSAAHGFALLIFALAEAALVCSTLYSLITDFSVPLLIFTLFGNIILLACAALSFKDFRESRMLAEEAEHAKTPENEFFSLKCEKIKAHHNIFQPIFSAENGNIYAFTLFGENGEKYTFFCVPSLDASKFAESTSELFGEIHVRKYKDTHLLCEIRKYI